MAMTINTNVISINAQRNLGLSGNSLGTTMQRLSSGLRVNSAKDDAAGLAIAERMNAQAKGLKVAARNANDGISLAQTAEGALGKVGDMLQRMRELAVQSSNATNSADDRKALQAEVSQLRSEIDRVAKTTSFNGKKILDGSFAGGVFQVGSNAGDNITVGGITNAKANVLGAAEYGTHVTATIKSSSIFKLDAIDAGTLKIRVGIAEELDLGAIGEASSGQERLGQVVAAINAKTADTGVTAFLVAGEVEGDYTVELRSEGDQVVSLTGFAAHTTGVGRKAGVALTTTNQTSYQTVMTKIDGLLAKSNISDIAVTEFTAATSGLEALVNGLDTATADALGGQGTAVSSALTALTQAVTSQGLNTAKSAGVASVAATSLVNGAAGVMTAWKTTSNQGTATAVDPSAKAADITVIHGALNDLKVALADALTAQQTANLGVAAGVKADFEAALAATTHTAFNDAVNHATTGLNAALTALNMGNVSAPALTAASTPEEWTAAKEQLTAQYNSILGSGFGIETSQVDEHLGLTDIDIGTQAGSWTAIKHIDAAIDQVNSARADLGALQTRFEKSIENIDIMNENISAARGRIVDADFAFETANLSRAQILQQAGTAMVAQANQLPQQVLSLLQ